MIITQPKQLELQILDLGRKSYKEAWNLQKKMQLKRMNGEIGDVLILV